uniref:Uncharacterized protein n=1 Tax=Arion vulgaris TaxID=1028688 RepID=A0A0B7AWR2_9EUPU
MSPTLPSRVQIRNSVRSNNIVNILFQNLDSSNQCVGTLDPHKCSISFSKMKVSKAEHLHSNFMIISNLFLTSSLGTNFQLSRPGNHLCKELNTAYTYIKIGLLPPYCISH